MASGPDETRTQNHYEVLGLSRGASTEDVKTAYRLRSHMFHPDKYENYPEPLRTQLKAEAAKEFKKLTAAYDVLRDPSKRAAHDRDLNVPVGRASATRATARPRRSASTRAARESSESGTERTRARRAADEDGSAGGAASAGPRAAARPAEPPRPPERDPLLVVRPEHLDFGAVAHGASKQLPLKISNAGGRTLFGEVTSNRAWLSVNRRSFISSSAIVFVSVDTTGLRPGEEYTGSLAVTTLNGGDQVVPVALRVSGKPEPLLAGAPSLLDFGPTQAGGRKARTVRLSNAGTGTLIGSIAVKGSWLGVTEGRFRGNDVSFEVIANTSGLPVGEHQGEVLIFSNGGQAAIQMLVEVSAPASGGAIVAGGRAQQTNGAPAGAAGAEEAAQSGVAPAEPPMQSAEWQRDLLKRIMLIEPATVWERDFLRRIVQMIRAGERLAPGELAKIYEMEARVRPEFESPSPF